METIAVTGASGAVGRRLVKVLTASGRQVVELVRGHVGSAREINGMTVQQRHWDPNNPVAHLLRDVDAVIHTAGEPIFGRFTDAHKRAMFDSRVEPTRKLAALSDGRTFVSASAIGYYGFDRPESVDETAPAGDGFLAGLCEAWEEASREAKGRNVQIRTGLAMNSDTGLLAAQLPLFRIGLGGPLGDGHQIMSWIAMDDLIQIYLRALDDEQITGPVNAVAPTPVSNNEFASALGRAVRRPVWLRVPSFAPGVLLGAEGNRELALASQNVRPAVLQSVGYQFLAPTIDQALGREVS